MISCSAFVPSKFNARLSFSSLPASKLPIKHSQRLSPEQKQLSQLHRDLQRLRKKRNGAQLAEQHLESLLQNYMVTPDGNSTAICPDEVCFNIVIMGYCAQSAKGDLTAPQQAEALVGRMKELHESGHHLLRPSIFTYNALMETWSRSRSSRAQSSVLRLFTELQTETHLEPNTFTYNLVLGAHVNKKSLSKALECYETMQSGGLPNVQPDRQTYNLLFKALAHHGEAQRAQDLLENVTQRYRDEQDDSFQPNQVWYNCVITAWAKSRLPEAGHRADMLLEEMQFMYEEEQSIIRPDATTYNQVMNAHAMQGNTTRAEQLLQQLERRHAAATGNKAMAPDTITYTTVIKAYANSNQPDAPEEATKVVRRMEAMAEASGRMNVAPNIMTYNYLIQIWVSTNTREGLQKATDILRSLQDNNNKTRPNRNVQPNSRSYSELIHGWSSSGYRDAGYRAEQLLHEMEQLPASRQKGVQLSTLYNSVIKAWAKSGDPTSPQRVDALLDLMEHKYFVNGETSACPNKITFLSMSDAYAKARVADAEFRCDALLERMAHLAKSGGVKNLVPDRALYNSMLNALAKSSQPSAVEKAEDILSIMETSDDPDLRPDIVTYATIIDCYTKSGDPTGPARAEELLELVEESYHDGDVLLKPNAVFYSAILQAWAKTATVEGAQRAEDLLRRNDKLFERGHHDYAKLHGIMYNAVIDAIARSRQPESVQRSEKLLEEMEIRYEAGDQTMQPTRRTLNAVMLACRQDENNGWKRAEQLLTRMEELAEAGVYEVFPDVVAYNCAMGAIADCDDPHAADRALALLDRMESLYKEGNKGVRPDGTTFSCVIDACLKRNDAKGTAMAHATVEKFLKLVESSKQTQEEIAADAVWNVINAHRRKQTDEQTSSTTTDEGLMRDSPSS